MDITDILSQILAELKTISNKLDKIESERKFTNSSFDMKSDILKEIEDAKRRKTAEIKQLFGKTGKD